VQNLDDIWGRFEHPSLYGILTNGLEWFIVAYESGRWRHSSVINTTKVSSTGKLIVDEEGISCLAKAIKKVLLNAIEWCHRLKTTNIFEINDHADGSNINKHHCGG